MLGHGEDAGLERIGLGGAVRGDAAHRLAPEVEHLGDVGDAPDLGEAQHEVVVLGAVEAGAEAANPADGLSASDDEVGDVVVVAQSLRREVRLVERFTDLAVGTQQGVIAVCHHVGHTLQTLDQAS